MFHVEHIELRVRSKFPRTCTRIPGYAQSSGIVLKDEREYSGLPAEELIHPKCCMCSTWNTVWHMFHVKRLSTISSGKCSTWNIERGAVGAPIRRDFYGTCDCCC